MYIHNMGTYIYICIYVYTLFIVTFRDQHMDLCGVATAPCGTATVCTDRTARYFTVCSDRTVYFVQYVQIVRYVQFLKYVQYERYVRYVIANITNLHNTFTAIAIVLF